MHKANKRVEPIPCNTQNTTKNQRYTQNKEQATMHKPPQLAMHNAIQCTMYIPQPTTNNAQSTQPLTKTHNPQYMAKHKTQNKPKPTMHEALPIHNKQCTMHNQQ